MVMDRFLLIEFVSDIPHKISIIWTQSRISADTLLTKFRRCSCTKWALEFKGANLAAHLMVTKVAGLVVGCAGDILNAFLTKVDVCVASIQNGPQKFTSFNQFSPQHCFVTCEKIIDSHGAGTVICLFTTGRGIGTETCEMDNVFPPDDL